MSDIINEFHINLKQLRKTESDTIIDMIYPKNTTDDVNITNIENGNIPTGVDNMTGIINNLGSLAFTDKIADVTTTKSGLMTSSDKVKLNNIESGANRYEPATYAETLLASNWDSKNKTYSFENIYPSDTYDIDLSLSGTCTDEEELAFLGARIRGSATSNIAKAKGNIPTIDIPVILKVVER